LSSPFRKNGSPLVRRAPLRRTGIYPLARARADTLVRREPRISAGIAWSDVQNWVRMSCARRKTACDVLEAARGRFVQTTENPAASPEISKLNPRRRSHSLFTNRGLR